MAHQFAQPLHDQLTAGLDFALVGIASLLHIALRYAVGTEEDVGRSGLFTTANLVGDQPRHGIDVARVVVVAADAADGEPRKLGIGLAQAFQLSKTGTTGTDREVGIEG